MQLWLSLCAAGDAREGKRARRVPPGRVEGAVAAPSGHAGPVAAVSALRAAPLPSRS